MKITRFASAIGTLGLLALTTAHAGVIEDRVNFKANNASMRALAAAIGTGDFATVKSEAEKIAAWAMVMPDYFPEGSGGSGTSARPEIWSDFVGFKDAAEANYYAAEALINAAAKQDGDAAREALQAIGASCKACHQKYKSW